ncbi:MAG: DUF1015 domain-containing protein, partial [Eubacterium sp.]|nr:DUF1015 domain-containing protein [Eubacterium sp.]
MVTIRPFKALKPRRDLVPEVAALPYDVYNREEAREVVDANPHSFLAIDRSETQFAPDYDMYSPEVYRKADEMIRQWTEEGIFVEDEQPCYYLWELTMNGRSQTGLVACSSVDDYLNGIVKKHENTRKDKEADRTNHVDVTSAQTGPIFLAYRNNEDIRSGVEAVKGSAPMLDYVAEDEVQHRVWKIADPEEVTKITEAFAGLANTYIADGHHRAASAVSVSQMRRKEHPDYTGEEEFNYFLSVLFPDNELEIMDYNRVIKDLNNMTPAEVLDKIAAVYTVEEAPVAPYRP